MHTYTHAYIHTCIHTHIHACMHACIGEDKSTVDRQQFRPVRSSSSVCYGRFSEGNLWRVFFRCRARREFSSTSPLHLFPVEGGLRLPTPSLNPLLPYSNTVELMSRLLVRTLCFGVLRAESFSKKKKIQQRVSNDWITHFLMFFTFGPHVIW